MSTGKHFKDHLSDCIVINVRSDCRKFYYTFECTTHSAPPEGSIVPVTKIACAGDSKDPWIGLAKAFQEMELLPSDAVKSELQATKYHLEDMRNLVFKG